MSAVLMSRISGTVHVCSPVCAEAFNPDEDDEDSEPRVVHPKTDEQRCRLQEACRDILLFKTLDQVSKDRREKQLLTRGLEDRSSKIGTLCPVFCFIRTDEGRAVVGLWKCNPCITCALLYIFLGVVLKLSIINVLLGTWSYLNSFL